MKPLPDANRRTVLKTIGSGVVGVAALTGVASADHGERTTFGTWGSDGTDAWEMLDTGHHPSNDAAHEPLYLIAPSDGCQSPHFGGVADHVLETPGGGNAYSAEWHVKAVVDVTTENLVDFTGESPTISKIDEVVANDEDLIIADTGGHFTCPVRPYHGGDC